MLPGWCGLQQSIQLNRANGLSDDFGREREPLVLGGRYQVKSCVHNIKRLLHSCDSEESEESVRGLSVPEEEISTVSSSVKSSTISSPCPFFVKTQEAMPLMSSFRMQS